MGNTNRTSKKGEWVGSDIYMCLENIEREREIDENRVFMGGGKCEGGAESRIILVIEWMEDIGGQLGWGVLLFASIFVCTTNIPSRSLSHSPLISLFFHILRGGLILIIVFEYCCLLLLSKRGGFIKASGQPFTMRILTNRCSFNPKLSLSYHNV